MIRLGPLSLTQTLNQLPQERKVWSLEEERLRFECFLYFTLAITLQQIFICYRAILVSYCCITILKLKGLKQQSLIITQASAGLLGFDLSRWVCPRLPTAGEICFSLQIYELPEVALFHVFLILLLPTGQPKVHFSQCTNKKYKRTSGNL